MQKSTPKPEKISASTRGWMCLVGHSSLAIIEKVSSAEEFLQVIKPMDLALKKDRQGPAYPLRALSLQVNTPETEWSFVPKQHFYLTQLNKMEGLSAQISHLNIPIHPFVQTKGLDLSEFYVRDVARLPIQQNAEGWFQYFFWLQEEIEILKEQFVPESIEEYTLEARLSDFIHEIRGALLKGVEEEISDSVLVLETLKSPTLQEITELEKDIIRKRFESYRGLKTQQEALRSIEEAIGSIAAPRPELTALRMKTRALLEFAGMETDPAVSKAYRWDQRILWMQLLNSLLGIVTVVSCDEDWERALFVFTVQVTLAQTIQEEGVLAAYAMILRWDDLTKNLNQLAFQGLRNKTADRADADLVLRFRERMWKNLEEMYKPHAKEGVKSGKINTDFLNFLPSHIDSLQEGGRKWIRVVKYDENGIPLDLGRSSRKKLGL